MYAIQCVCVGGVCVCVFVLGCTRSVIQSCPALCNPRELQPARFLCLWDFPGKNTEVGYPALLQGICPSQGWNPHLPESLALHYL